MGQFQGHSQLTLLHSHSYYDYKITIRYLIEINTSNLSSLYIKAKKKGSMQ